MGMPVSKWVKCPNGGFSLTFVASFDSCQRIRVNTNYGAPAPVAAFSAPLPRLKSSFGFHLKLSLPCLHTYFFPLTVLNSLFFCSQGRSRKCSLSSWHCTEHPHPAVRSFSSRFLYVERHSSSSSEGIEAALGQVG